jgi:hypothetical protein
MKACEGNIVEEAGVLLYVVLGGEFVFSAEKSYFESIGDQPCSKIRSDSQRESKAVSRNVMVKGD